MYDTDLLKSDAVRVQYQMTIRGKFSVLAG